MDGVSYNMLEGWFETNHPKVLDRIKKKNHMMAMLFWAADRGDVPIWIRGPAMELVKAAKGESRELAEFLDELYNYFKI